MFFIIVFSTFFALSSYVFIRGFQALPPFAIVKIIYSILFISGFVSFFLRMYFGDKIDERYAVPLSEVGFTFIIALVYFAIFALGFDILRILNHFFSIFPEIVTSNWTFVKQGALALSVISVIILLIVGSINFNNPVVTTYQINTEKNLPGGELKLVLVSDIHLSTSINSKHLKKYVKLINDQRGDAVFLAGDIADRDVRPLIDQKMGEELAKLSAPMGVFAITGNHEFYGGDKDEIYKILREAGINVLIDSLFISPHGFAVAGRDDLTNHRRAPLDSILKDLERESPVILMDHQPKTLDDAVRNQIDLQFSGHTHRGQFWPGNLITEAMFDLAYGHARRGDTDFIVTSGLGLWGPKYRIGTKSEVVVIEWKQLPTSTGTTASKSTPAESSKSATAESTTTETSTSKSTGPATTATR